MTRRTKPRARVVAMASLALFATIFALLAFQLRSGRDPALGRGTVLLHAAVPPARHVVVRKIIVTRVIVHLPAEEDGSPTVASVPIVTTAPAAAPAAAPVTTVPAPAPATAPAPLTTRAS